MWKTKRRQDSEFKLGFKLEPNKTEQRSVEDHTYSTSSCSLSEEIAPKGDIQQKYRPARFVPADLQDAQANRQVVIEAPRCFQGNEGLLQAAASFFHSVLSGRRKHMRRLMTFWMACWQISSFDAQFLGSSLLQRDVLISLPGLANVAFL